mmetsp:Transcript_91/g.120  ORF Transcript_91/g.120 Transcript_91/m.120 type:complete len:272 (-) Transcript_91:990-1805(-)
MHVFLKQMEKHNFKPKKRARIQSAHINPNDQNRMISDQVLQKNNSNARKNQGKDSKGVVKADKGLRHFSMKVCKKIQEKKQTTQNVIADELVQELLGKDIGGEKGSSKNIRRRIYDAINVLEAMGIVSKDKKEITWRGLTSTSKQDIEELQRERDHCIRGMQLKRGRLIDQLVQTICFRNLIRKNRNRAVKKNDAPEESPAYMGISDDIEKIPRAGQFLDDIIPIPFIVFNSLSETVIQYEVRPERTEVLLNFGMPFEIKCDIDFFKRLRL